MALSTKDGRASRVALSALAAMGLLISAYLPWVHFARVAPACVGGSGGCETVQSSRYATILGVPVSVLGMVGYAGLLFSAALRSEDGVYLGHLIAVAGTLFSAYLTFREGLFSEVRVQKPGKVRRAKSLGHNILEPQLYAGGEPGVTQQFLEIRSWTARQRTPDHRRPRGTQPRCSACALRFACKIAHLPRRDTSSIRGRNIILPCAGPRPHPVLPLESAETNLQVQH